MSSTSNLPLGGFREGRPYGPCLYCCAAGHGTGGGPLPISGSGKPDGAQLMRQGYSGQHAGISAT